MSPKERKAIRARMAALPPPDLTDPDVPEWTKEDFARARPGYEMPPEILAAVPRTRRPGERGPQRAPTKKPVTIRLDQAVIEHFKAGGAGWQSRINDVLVREVGKR